MKLIARIALLCLLALSPALADETPPLTNADVVKMVNAQLSDSTVILAIERHHTAFDTSTEALIELKTSGVSAAVIDRMFAPTPASTKPMPPSQPPGSTLNATTLSNFWGTKQTRVEADRVFLVDGESRTEMKFTKPGTRTKMFYGMQQFAVLPGVKARMRGSNHTPHFEMILPNNVEITSVVALGMLGVRGNGTREILIGGGFLAMSNGIPKERNMAIDCTKVRDQSQAPEGYEIYQISPSTPLNPGEYALMISLPSEGAMGPMGSARMSYNFYELGLD